MTDNHSINLADDNFIRSVINRQVGKLIAKSDFTQQDRSDLVQEVFVRATKSLRLYDPSIGHLYPYVCTVVQRHLANVARDRSVVKRKTTGRVSLSKTVRGDDGGQVEMSQALHDQDQDRRLGRERRLGEQDLNDLRMDLAAFMSKLPDKFQDLLRRRQTQSITEISRDLGIPRTTLNDWMLQIRKLFEEAGFERYLEA
ncbi:MAG: sigma-70 family RNA polymerase sigma factor [Planctomycetes bacterium]|nr:sigma-70 family RNA polymerase sigma factor [Planctomycetota bacterium]